MLLGILCIVLSFKLKKLKSMTFDKVVVFKKMIKTEADWFEQDYKRRLKPIWSKPVKKAKR